MFDSIYENLFLNATNYVKEIREKFLGSCLKESTIYALSSELNKFNSIMIANGFMKKNIKFLWVDTDVSYNDKINGNINIHIIDKQTFEQQNSYY